MVFTEAHDEAYCLVEWSSSGDSLDEKWAKGLLIAPANREFSVRYCIASFMRTTLLPVAPGIASFLRLAACASRAHFTAHPVKLLDMQ